MKNYNPVNKTVLVSCAMDKTPYKNIMHHPLTQDYINRVVQDDEVRDIAGNLTSFPLFSFIPF